MIILTSPECLIGTLPNHHLLRSRVAPNPSYLTFWTHNWSPRTKISLLPCSLLPAFLSLLLQYSFAFSFSVCMYVCVKRWPKVN